MSLTLLTLGLLTAPPAQAQGGWSVTDNSGNPIQPLGNGYPLTGTASGSATNTYPQDMKDAALTPPFYSAAYGEWVDNRQWIQPSSGGPATYSPNELANSEFYGGAFPLTTSISLNASAHNYSLNNNYYGSFNPGDPPFYTSQYYQDQSACEPVIGSVNGSSSGTLWANWNWMGPGAAPNYLNILLTTNVVASKSLSGSSSGQGSLSAASTASDGSPFGETATSDGAVQRVFGRHLLRVPVSNGVAAVSLNGKVSASATNTVPYGGFNSYYTGYYGGTNGALSASSYASVSATANTDSRAVQISSLLGTTYHKGANAQRAENEPDPYTGTLTDDTVAASPNNDTVVATQAEATGSWNPGSSYVWSQSWAPAGTMTGVADPDTKQGTFPSDNITPPFYVDYFTQQRLTNVPTSHVSVLVTDSGDGATASADYFLNFHNEYDQIVGTGQTMGDWTRVTPAVNPGPTGDGLTFSQPVQISVSITVSVSPSGAAGNAIAAAYGVTDLGATYSTVVPRNVPYKMSADKYCWVEDQPQWLQITGTADNYERSGYQSQIPFTLNKAIHSSNPLVDFNERFIISDNPPSQ